MSKKNINVPKVPNLRFKDFQGEWEVKKLGQVLKIGSGKDYKHLKEGDIPVFGTGGYITSVDQYLLDGETVFIGRKGTINKPFYYKGKFWTVDTLFYTHTFENVLPKFLFYILDRINWLNHNEASGVPSLSKRTIEQICISIPDIMEQKKIAPFLSLIGERISTQIKIIEGLESLMRELRKKIFTQKLRFKDTKGNDFPNWTVKKLAEVAEKQITKNKNISVKSVFSNSASLGIVNQLDFFDKEIANQNNINGYYIVKKNDFVYNPRISNEALFGPISRNKIGLGVMSPLYIVFQFTKGNIDFFEHFYHSDLWHKHMESIANYGARADRMSFSSRDFFNMPIPYPSAEEQIHITSALASIKEKIETEKNILQLYKKQKKYLLQNLFI